MSPTVMFVLFILVGLAFAYMAGEAIDRGHRPIGFMLGWLSLCFLWMFIKA